MPKEPKVRVLFRVDRNGPFAGNVTAVFPDLEAGKGEMTCYAHVGQHSGCTKAWMQRTRPATAAEAAPLKRELTKIGYNLRVIKRATRRR